MADAKLGVVAVLKDEASAGLDNVGKAVSRVGDHSVRAAAGTDSLSKALGLQNLTVGQLAGALLGVGTGLALIGSITGAVKGVIEGIIGTTTRFGSEMAGVGAVSGSSADQLQRLGELARTGGVDIGVGAVEGAKGLQELVKGGVSVDAALTGGLRATELMAKAGGVDLATAAEISAVALNSFGLSGGQLAHVADLVAGAANASSISVDDFRMSMSQTGAVARTIGFNIDDVSVAIAELGQAGIKGSDAGTSLRTFMLRLSPTTAEATDEMRKLGIITGDGTNQFFNAAGKIKNLSQVQEILKTSLIGMTDQQKLSSLNIIFGTDAIRSASVMAREGATGFDALQAAMAKVSAEDVSKKRLDSLGGDLEKLSAQAESTAVSLGKVLDPALRGGAQAASGALNAASKVDVTSSQQNPLFDALGSGLHGAHPMLGLIGDTLNIATMLHAREAARDVSVLGQSLDVSFQAEQEANRASLSASAAKVAVTRDQAKELDKASAAGQRLNDVIGHQMAVLGRDNLSLKVQEASIQEQLLPLKEREAELALQILESTDKKTSLQMEGAAIQARINAAQSSNALEDADFEERRLRAKIKVDALSGKGVSGSDVAALMKIGLAKPGLELAALVEGRSVTLAERAKSAFNDKNALGDIPGQMDKAGLDLQIAQKEREIARIKAEAEAGNLANAPKLAALEAQKRALEDKAFTAAQLKADKEGKSGIVLNIQQFINSTGEVDYDRIIQDTQTAVVEGFRKAQAADPGLPQPSFTPGSRGTGSTGPF